MDDYKIEDLEATNNFMSHITSGEELTIEREESKEKVIEEGLDTAEEKEDEVK